jgi:nucleoside-diphosphate-sugar epimerase
MAKGNVLSTIINQIETEGPIRVFDSTPVRDFLWIGDAARMLSDMVMSKETGVYNGGSGVGVSIHDIATEILSASGQFKRQVESTQPTNRFSNLVLDIEQTKVTFGWRPVVSLAEGLSILLNTNPEK